MGHDYAQPADGLGNLPPWIWWIPPTVGGGIYYVYILNEATGELSDATTISITGSDPPACTSYVGGLFKYVPAQTGCERHHIPSQASWRGIGNYTRNCTPVIRMDKLDHQATASWGRFATAGVFRSEERDEILAGNFAGAFDKNVNEDLHQFGTRYDAAIAQARLAMTQLPPGGTSTC